MSYSYWRPFEVPKRFTDSAHDYMGRIEWWINLTDPLLEKLRAAGYKNPRLMTQDQMNNISWIVVDEHIVNPNNPPWPHHWKIVRHSGLGVGCGNSFNSQLIHFQELEEKGFDETHCNRTWTNAPCCLCFPDRYKAAVKAGARPFRQCR